MSEVESGGSAEERAEAEKFNAMVVDHRLTAAEASQIEKDKTPEEVEAEYFQSLTKRTMEQLKSIKDPDKNLDYPEEFRETVNEVDVIGTAQMAQSRLLAAFLFEGKKNKEKPVRIECPVTLDVLDVGGYDGDFNRWHNIYVFGFHDNYTGISLDDDASTLYRKGTIKDGNRVETLRMNVLDVDKEFEDRKFNFIIAQGFFGYPTDYGAKSRGLAQEKYEEQILNILDKVLVDGGFIVLGNREWPAITPERIKELGFDFMQLMMLTFKTWVLRKIPEAEKGEESNTSMG